MSLSKLLFTIGFSTSISEVQAAPNCTALAMSGGGSFGAWEAGVLYGMYYAEEDKFKFQYDVVSGVSAGAINGAAMATFAPGDEVNMLETLS
jgi:predicted acylesterase/phospholipase RssA